MVDRLGWGDANSWLAGSGIITSTLNLVRQNTEWQPNLIHSPIYSIIWIGRTIIHVINNIKKSLPYLWGKKQQGLLLESPHDLPWIPKLIRQAESGRSWGPREEGRPIPHSWGQPRVFEAVAGSCSLWGIEGQHGAQEIAECSGLLLRPFVFLCEHLKHAPWTQFGDMLQVTYQQNTESEYILWVWSSYYEDKNMVNIYIQYIHLQIWQTRDHSMIMYSVWNFIVNAKLGTGKH